MNLTFDLPIQYNDLSQSEIGQLSIKIKKLVDDLNYILNNISEENISSALKDKLNSTADNAEKALSEIKEMKEGETNVSSVGTTLS